MRITTKNFTLREVVEQIRLKEIDLYPRFSARVRLEAPSAERCAKRWNALRMLMPISAVN